MTNRRGDWRDLLSSYHIALRSNKIWVGFLALLCVLLVMVLASFIYASFADWGLIGSPAESVVALGRIGGEQNLSLLRHIANGTGLQGVAAFLPLLNPFHNGDVVHLLLSSLTYVALFWSLSGAGGVISRLTSLEYAREDIPILGDVRAMVRAKRKDYFFAFLWPFLFVIVPALINALIGLFCSIPYVGRVALVPLYFVAFLMSGMAWLFAVGWLLSFGMMMPAVSAGGKDAFDGWSTSYAYVLWQFGRYVCYTLVVGVVGVLSAVAAYWLVEVLIYMVYESINLGFVGGTPWVDYQFGGQLQGLVWEQGGLSAVVSAIIAWLTLAVRGIPVAYVISYFFTANTLVYFLLRKHVDNIEIDEIYEEEEWEEEEFGAPVPEGEEAAEEPEAEEEAAEGAAEEEEPAEEPAEEEEEPVKEPAEEEPEEAEQEDEGEEEPEEEEPEGEEEE